MLIDSKGIAMRVFSAPARHSLRNRIFRAGATVTLVAGAFALAPQAAYASCGTIYKPCGGDPSGVVVDTRGRPVSGASVVLMRAANKSSVYLPVADGADVLSSTTPKNPETTTTDGHFAWDVASGTYRVVAVRQGCGVVTSAPVTVPPGTTTLTLVLRCG